MSIKRNPCTVEGCTNPIFAKKLCLHHQYKRTDKKPSTLSSQPSEKVSKKPPCKSKKEKSTRPIAKISEKQKRRLVKYRIRRDKFLKENPVCMFPDCTSTFVECHHAAGKIGHLLYTPKYFRSLCRMHHEYIERNVTLAKQLGLSVDRINK